MKRKNQFQSIEIDDQSWLLIEKKYILVFDKKKEYLIFDSSRIYFFLLRYYSLRNNDSLYNLIFKIQYHFQMAHDFK